jgi:hypothetical protein
VLKYTSAVLYFSDPLAWGVFFIFQKSITEGLSRPLDIINNTEIFIQVNYKHQNVKITLKYYVTQKINKSASLCVHKYTYIRLVIGTSRTVGSAKKFVRITFGFGGGEFTKTLRKVCTCQKLKFSFLLLEYCEIRECYAVANTFTIRNMYSLFLYMKCNSSKINCPTKNRTTIVTLLHF